jgi:hypothetical protein
LGLGVVRGKNTDTDGVIGAAVVFTTGDGTAVAIVDVSHDGNVASAALFAGCSASGGS